MIEFRQCPRFAPETLGEGGVLTHMGSQNLKSHKPLQLDLPRLVDDAHTPETQQFKNLQLREIRGQVFDLGRSEPAPGGRWGCRNFICGVCVRRIAIGHAVHA